MLLLACGGWTLRQIERLPAVREFPSFVRDQGLDTGELFYTESELAGEVEFDRLKAECKTLHPCQ